MVNAIILVALAAANTSHEEIAAEIALPDGKTIRHVFPRYGYIVRRPQL